MIRRCSLAALAVSLVTAFVAVTPAAVPAAEIGVNPISQQPSQALDAMGQLGATWVRAFVRWDQVEQAGPGRWVTESLAPLDEYAAAASLRGIKVVAVVTGAPQWANGTTDPYVPPRDPADFGRFLNALAARERGRVAAWEIWNEPDEKDFWHGPVGPQYYAPLLKAAHAGITAADPGALVLAGASTGNDYPFLEGLYANGAGDAFSGVAVHTDTACLVTPPDSYYRDPGGKIGRFSFLGFREVHDVLARYGHADRPIIMTELGWSATKTRCSRGASAGKKAAGVSEAQQAANLKLAYRCLSFYPYVEAAIWFSAQDYGAPDAELNRYGLLRFDGSKRPAYDALAAIGRNGPPTTGDCGDFDPPSVSILAPTAGTYFDQSLPISVSAKDAHSKLGRITFYANGKKIRSFTEALKNDKPVGLEWMGARALPYGPVTVTIEALDSWGNVTRRDIAVQRVDPRSMPPQKTLFAKLRVYGSGLKRTVTGQLKAFGPFAPDGKVKLEWQYRRGSAWVTLHKKSKNAARPFVYRQRLARAGRWRLRASYVATKPFQATSTAKAFRAR